jgi:predicted signal transduction protein with EAL and GGDEF domain
MLTFIPIVIALVLLGWLAQVQRKNRALERELQRLHNETESHSRLRDLRALKPDLELELLRASRTGTPTALIVLGRRTNLHEAKISAGVPSDFGEAMTGVVRAFDIGYRIARDEYALVLPDTQARGALVAAHRVVQALLDASAAPEGIVAGIADAGPGITSEQLFRNAYVALLAAGQDGRADATVYSRELEPVAELQPSRLSA